MLQPLRDVVLIKADPAIGKSDGGILLGENWKQLPLKGEVLAVGPEVTNVKAGQRVGFNRYASIMLEDDNRLCKERHIIWQE